MEHSMKNLFLIQLIISFVVGGLFIALLTLVAERVSLKWRGAVLSLPSTVVISFFFIGLTKSPADVTGAAIASVAGTLASSFIFVLVFSFLARWNLFISLAGAFAAWACSTYVLLAFPPHSFFSAIFFLRSAAVDLNVLAYQKTSTRDNDHSGSFYSEKNSCEISLGRMCHCGNADSR